LLHQLFGKRLLLFEQGLVDLLKCDLGVLLKLGDVVSGLFWCCGPLLFDFYLLRPGNLKLDVWNLVLIKLGNSCR
jgi:hypothetical protein